LNNGVVGQLSGSIVGRRFRSGLSQSGSEFLYILFTAGGVKGERRKFA
jgi:hypothetical protein